jgi:hypothetical protein
MIERTIPGQREEPWFEGAAGSAIARCVAPKQEKNVLHNLLGGGLLLQNSQYERINRQGVPVVQRLERAGIALSETFHQSAIGRRR